MQIDQELDRIKVILQNRQRRALKLFQNHTLELRRYYTQVLRHASFIFWVGVGCIALGFGVIGVTLWLSVAEVTNDRQLTAALGLVGSLAANFIGLLYLRMYATTIQSLGTFHDRLVETHRIHFANFLASNVNQGRSREQTLADMAARLAVRQSASEPPPASANGAAKPCFKRGA